MKNHSLAACATARLTSSAQSLCKPMGLLSSLLLGSLTAAWAQAQTLPDAGSLRQQIEQQRELHLPQAAPLTRVTPPPEIRPQAGLSVKVKAFRFTGNQLLSAEQLTPALSEFVGRTLDFAGLQRTSDAVAAAYREAGWLVRVYLPEQDVSEGTITLQIVEARFAGLRFEGAPSQRVRHSEIEAWFKARQASGQPLNADALDRALLLADDLPGVSVAGTLAPGATDGETALVLQSTDEPYLYGDIGLDNTGSRSTGSNRVTANLNINSPGGRGELVAVNLLHSQGSDYARVSLTVPDGYNGLRLGVNASSMSYRVVEGSESMLALKIKGHSSSLGVDWSYPLVRARLHNLYFSGGLDNKHFDSDNRSSNLDDPKSYADYDSNSLRLGLSGNHFDNWGGGGANSGSLQITWGRLDMQAHSQIDSLKPSYNKLNYSLSRQQSLTGAHSLLVSLQGQHATQGLDSSEKFYIGGASTVRAYPASELGGERGQLLTAEWRWRLSQAWTLTAFVDHGRIVSLPATSSDQASTMNLSGHGLSVSWQGPMGLTSRLTWSHRNGTNPKPTQSGTDGDGTLKRNRLWLTASLPF